MWAVTGQQSSLDHYQRPCQLSSALSISNWVAGAIVRLKFLLTLDVEWSDDSITWHTFVPPARFHATHTQWILEKSENGSCLASFLSRETKTESIVLIFCHKQHFPAVHVVPLSDNYPNLICFGSAESSRETTIQEVQELPPRWPMRHSVRACGAFERLEDRGSVPPVVPTHSLSHPQGFGSVW